MAPRGYSQNLHEWNLTPTAAVEVQRRLRDQIHLENHLRDVRTIGGADISFNRFSKVVYAGLVVIALPGLDIIDSVAIRTTVDFPYIPGLLSFREAPPLLEAWERLRRRPDLLMLDGHGIAHPRRFGIASHLGLLLDLPTIGCAKTRLVGHYTDPAPEPG
ncbi:MAG: endonuclease V, partial [Acidobacteriota bacterium]